MLQRWVQSTQTKTTQITKLFTEFFQRASFWAVKILPLCSNILLSYCHHKYPVHSVIPERQFDYILYNSNRLTHKGGACDHLVMVQDSSLVTSNLKQLNLVQCLIWGSVFKPYCSAYWEKFMPHTMFPEVKDGQITGEVYKHNKKGLGNTKKYGTFTTY